MKTKKRLLSILLSLVLALSLMPALSISARADSSTSSLVFTAKCNGSGTADDRVVWTVTSDASETNFDGERGIHYGSNNKEVQYIRLSTSGITAAITKVVVNATAAGGVMASVNVTVGGTAFGGDAKVLGTDPYDYTFEGSGAGEIVVTVSKPSAEKKALYVKSVVVTYSTHSHSFTYTASGDTITATCSADNCPLDDGSGNHTATLTLKPPANLVYSGSAKEVTVEGTIPDVETPSIKYIGRGNTAYNESTTAPTATGDYTASVTLGEKTASVEFTIKDASYTITIPSKLTVENAGWNATAGVTASGEIAEGTKLTVTAASANEWALKSGDNSVGYYLATAEGGEQVTAWSFTAEELAAENGTNKPMGAVVEEYINKPAGDYADTVTFTAEIRSLLNTITISGTELIYADGDTWAQIVERNPGKIRIAGSSNNRIWRAQDNPLYIGGRTPVLPTDTIDPSLKYGFEAD